jgi:hypothetical protein
MANSDKENNQHITTEDPKQRQPGITPGTTTTSPVKALSTIL